MPASPEQQRTCCKGCRPGSAASTSRAIGAYRSFSATLESAVVSGERAATAIAGDFDVQHTPIEASSGRRHIFAYGSLMYPAVWSRIVRGEYRSPVGYDSRIPARMRTGVEHPALVIAPRAEALRSALLMTLAPTTWPALITLKRPTTPVCSWPPRSKVPRLLRPPISRWNVEDHPFDQEWDAARFEHTGLANF